MGERYLMRVTIGSNTFTENIDPDEWVLTGHRIAGLHPVGDRVEIRHRSGYPAYKQAWVHPNIIVEDWGR